WQWCHDWYSEGYYADSPSEDPRGPADGKMRVLRGGACDVTAEKCRAAYRYKEFPVFTDACFGADFYGFRRARRAGPTGAPTVAGGPKTEPPKKLDSPPKTPVQAARGSSKIDLARLKGTIIFASDRSGTMSIWSMRASGQDAKQLTQGPSPAADPQ